MSRQKDLAAIDPYEANRGLCQAQQAGKIPRIGWIVLGSPAGSAADVFSYYDSFRAGLSELGYVEDNNIILVARSAEGLPERLPRLVDELLRENVSVIVSPGPAKIHPGVCLAHGKAWKSYWIVLPGGRAEWQTA